MTKQEKKKQLKELWGKVEFKIEPKKTVEISSNYTKEFKGVKK